MEILALLSSRDDIMAAVKGSLTDFTVYPVRDLTGLEDILLSVPVSLLILDGYSVKPSDVDDIMSLYPIPVILLTDEGFNLRKLSEVPETISMEDIAKTIGKSVKNIVERKRLEDEIRVLNEARLNREGTPPVNQPHIVDYPGRKFFHEQMLLKFAKTLTVNFDVKKLLTHFMESVMEISRVNRMSILLREKEVFRIKAQIGIEPYFAANIKLSNNSPLIKWLSTNGRVLSSSIGIRHDLYPGILKEMELLQCVFAFPMIYKGKLIGVFAMDNKITGDPFYREELEVVFMLCNYLSAAVRDIESFHQIQYQKEFTRNILANMNSGVITINSDERISIFNQRASEILKRNALDMIGSDLRKLPSPLGDILYETMTQGTSYRRHETVIKPDAVPLGINSYRLLDENKSPIGAVIVFTDLSDAKKFEEERRKAEKLEAVNNLIGKIAHEIKNPLTSIRTFTQLLNEKFHDGEFREFFRHTVMQSINQLNSLVDRLVLFSGPLSITPGGYSIKEIIAEAEALAQKDLPDGTKLVKKFSGRDVHVSVDRGLFTKALYYLILVSAEKSLKKDSVILQVNEPSDEGSPVEIHLKFPGTPLTEKEKEAVCKPLFDIDAFGIELNIPISQKIIEEHNGTLAISSNGEGNSYVITLPTVEKSNIST